MDYYKLKKQASANIKKLAGEGVTYEDIVFFIFEEYGLSEKFVQNYYDELLARGFVKKKKAKKAK